MKTWIKYVAAIAGWLAAIAAGVMCFIERAPK